MTKETSDMLSAVGAALGAIATCVAVAVSWSVYRGQLQLSRRQLLIPLWERMTSVRSINVVSPATPQVLNAANTLELIAVSVEGGMVDPAVIKRTFSQVFISVYDQIASVRDLPGYAKPRSGIELLDDYPSTQIFYKELVKERLQAEDRRQRAGRLTP